MDKDQKTNWKCPQCRSKQPKKDNSNTPVHHANSAKSRPLPILQIDDLHNVNTRTRKPACTRNESPERVPVTQENIRDILQEVLPGILKNSIKELVSQQLREINCQISSFSDSLNFFNGQFEHLKTAIEERNGTVDKLQKENDVLKTIVSDLSARLCVVEQNMRDNNIEINGVPEHKTENLTSTLQQLARTVGTSIEDGDILHVTRVAKLNKDSDRPRAVIAKLRSTRQRDTILAAVAQFNKKNPEDKLSSHHLGVGGPRAPVFVSEHLTPANKQLHAATRKYAKEQSYKFVWVRNGRIYVRKNETCQSLVIRNHDSLRNLV